MLPQTGAGPTPRLRNIREPLTRALPANEATKPATEDEPQAAPAEAPATQLPEKVPQADQAGLKKGEAKGKERQKEKEKVKGNKAKHTSTLAYKPPPLAALDYQLAMSGKGEAEGGVFGMMISPLTWRNTFSAGLNTQALYS